jgi:hypothetical protein
MRQGFSRCLVVAAIAALPVVSAFAQHSPVSRPSGSHPQIGVVDPTKGEQQPTAEATEFTLGMSQLLGGAPRSFTATPADSKTIVGVTVADAESFHFLVAGFDANGNFATQCVQGQAEAAAAETAAASPSILRLRVRRPVVMLETE